MKLLNLFLLLSVVVWATSCLDTADPAVSGAGDTYLVCKKVNGNTAYGLSLNAFTYGEFKKVTVQGVDAANVKKSYNLAAKQGYKTNFYWETPDSLFSTTPPTETVFTFTATFSDETKQVFQDVLTADILAVPAVSAAIYNDAKSELQITWAKVPNADTYAVALLDQENKVIFSSSEQYASKSVSYTIGVSGNGWASSARPVAGKTYKLRVYAFKYEAEVNAYNLQALSFVDKDIVWASLGE